jgi:hypothetical protein
MAVTHGQSNHPVYRIWIDMRSRCLNPSHQSYSDYGGRGITVCQEWIESFETFLNDVGERPFDPPDWTGKTAFYSIDRIDNDRGYEPGNVRWATPAEQQLNKRSARRLRTREELIAAGWQ